MKAENNSGAKNESKQNHKQEDQQDEELRRGPWTLEEDTMLIHYVACHGEGRWNLLAKSAGLKRTGKSCRLRWLNYLKPDIKRGNLSPQEQLLILELHSKWGNRWSKIAAHLPGRTDNEIKNYWRTRVQKQARQLNMESNSQGFIDAIRCFYMPRLVQKIEQNSTDHDLTTLNDYCDQESTAAQSQIIMLSSSTKLEEDINNFDATTITKDINNNNNTSSSNATSTSRVSISSIPEFQDQPSPSDVITNTKGSSVGLLPLHDDHDDDTNHHCVNNCDEYDMDMSAGSEFPYMGCQMEGNDWLGNNVAGDGIMWDLDELWQFRK